MRLTPEQRKQFSQRLRLCLSKKFSFPLVKPERITLVINHYCNLRCVMCDLWRSKDNREMAWETARKIIDEMKDWGADFLNFTGGEPFLHKDFFRMVDYAGERGITTEVNTNAFVPPEMGEKILASSLSRLNISLDGATAATHDRIRGRPGSFDRIGQLLKVVNQNRKSAVDKPVLIISCTIMDYNLEELTAIVDFARQNLFSGVSFGVATSGLVGLRPGGRRGPQAKLPEFWVPPSRYPILQRSIDALIAIKRADPGIIHNTIDYLRLIVPYFTLSLPDQTNSCFAGFNNLHIDTSGATGCCGGSFGNSLRRPLWRNWKSLRSFAIRRRVSRCRKPCLVGCYTNTGAESLKIILRDLRHARRSAQA